MEVYIELAIIDNFIINGIIIMLTLFALRIPIKWYKVLLSTALGTAFAIVVPLFYLSTPILMCLKLMVGLAMILVASPKMQLRELILMYVIFITFTFVMGGFCFFIIYLFGGDASKLPVPTSVFIFGMFVYVFFLIKGIKAFYYKRRLHNNIYDISISYQGRTVKSRAYLDSGNTLTDNGKSVVIISPKLFNKLSPIPLNEVIMYRKHKDFSEGHFVRYSTISGNSKLFVFSADEFKLIGKQTVASDCLIGVSYGGISGQYEALIGNRIVEGL